MEAYPPESPLQFIVGSGAVIPGLEYTIKNMSVGEQVRAIIPPQFAYGDEGVKGRVPSAAVLVYDVYLASIA